MITVSYLAWQWYDGWHHSMCSFAYHNLAAMIADVMVIFGRFSHKDFFSKPIFFLSVQSRRCVY